MQAIRLNNSWTSWIWDQYLPENTKWNFDNIGSAYFKTLWNFESLKLWNFEKVGFGVYGGLGCHFFVNIMKSITFRCYLENPKTHQFHDFSIFGCGSKTQRKYYLSLETLAYLKQIKKSTDSFSCIMFGSLKISEIEIKVSKRRVPNDSGDPFQQFLKIFNMDSISSDNVSEQSFSSKNLKRKMQSGGGFAECNPKRKLLTKDPNKG